MDDLIIFGASGFGKKAISYLEKNYNVLCWLDNDCTKWGKEYENYIVNNPQEAVGFQGKIMVTSVYKVEIEKQLIALGIQPRQIYSICVRQTDTGYQYEEYPLDEQFLEAEKKDLQEYDVLNNVERESDRIKIMLFCVFYSTYTKQLIENMARCYHDLEFSLITSDSESGEKITSEALRHIYVFHSKPQLKNILEKIPVYSVMQLLWIEPEWCYFYRLIRQKSRLLNLNVGGSDFYRTGKGDREYKRKLICVADTITAETPQTVADFLDYYGKDAEGKMGLLPFGVQVLDYIDELRGVDKQSIRKKFNLPNDKLVVTCGHNKIRFHQHLAIINAIEKLPDEVKERLICVFPMTYPDGLQEYIDEVREALEQSGLDYLILETRMTLKEMAMYALVSDIMIHVQKTDQLSSTMLEEMYAGSIVIAGSWLPYGHLHKKGISFWDVNNVSDITSLLEDIVKHLEIYRNKCTENSSIVYSHSSWDVLSKKWYELWRKKKTEGEENYV